MLIINQHLQNRMKYTKEDKRKHLILMCRYYDGTEEDIYLKKLEAHEIDKSHLPPPECMKDEYTLSVEEVAHLKNAHTARCYEEHWVNGSLKFEITAKRLYAASQRVL